MTKRGLSGSTLKIIAIITMIIDHIAAVVFVRMLLARGNSALLADADAWLIGFVNNENLLAVYQAMRGIGRIAFPLFCFLLVEGFSHTSNIKKYAFRLSVFALVSEIPFDLAFHGKLLEFTYQNVFFTLLIGLLTITLFHWLQENQKIQPWLKVLLLAVTAVGGMGLAHVLHTDYAARGVMCILVLYVFRKSRESQIIAGVLSFFWWELPAVLAFLPIALYNGKRGISLKYAFYAIYPIHLLVLYGICVWLGLDGIAAV